jgi:hypothetical protein
MRYKIHIVILLIVACGCATAAPPSTPQTQLAARIEHASTHNPCLPGQSVTANCLDDQGLVWTMCAWNSCGFNEECRKWHQTSLVRGNCGPPDWPACGL